jgi:hypothetical protein
MESRRKYCQTRFLTVILLVKPSDDLSDDVGSVETTMQFNLHCIVKLTTY